MHIEPHNYSIYFDFIETYLPSGFKDINRDDPILLKMEEVLEKTNQYFSIIDLEEPKFLFTSKGSLPLIGVEPDELNPLRYLDVVHPDDMNIQEWVRIQRFRLEHLISEQKGGNALMSFTIRMKDTSGIYHNYLGQNYLFCSKSTCSTVYALQIGTLVDWCRIKKICFHRYVGNDLSLFRFPDEDLLSKGLIYSKRELEIIKLISGGYNSKEIAHQLSLSPNTVNKHRSNILDKSRKETLMDVIYDLKEDGHI